MITAKLLREWHACWDDARITTYLAGRSFVTLRQIASDVSLSFDDRLWVLCHAMHDLDERACRLYAIESAQRTTPQAGDEDGQALHATLLSELIEIEDRPESEQTAAWDTAWTATCDARYDAWTATCDARYATWAAAGNAARYAARAAAWSVAWSAAARDAALGAELDNAIARAIKWLGEWADEEVMP